MVSLKSTFQTLPIDLERKIQKDLESISKNTFFNYRGTKKIYFKNIKSRELRLTFEQGFAEQVGTRETFKTLKKLEKKAIKKGIKFEWSITAANGQVYKGWDFFQSVKGELRNL